MHNAVRQYFERVKRANPDYFVNKVVLDCGSYDINGNNRFLFKDCDYTGIDIVKGKNVDVVTKIHEYRPFEPFDVVISSEMLEHDKFYVKTLKAMFTFVKHQGLLVFTAAGTGRPEHGTTRTSPKDSPMTNDYYCNVTVDMIKEGLDLSAFSAFDITEVNKDIQFWGIKK